MSVKKVLIASAIATAFIASGAQANQYLEQVGGHVGWQFGTSDQVLLTNANSDADADVQGFVLGLDYQDSYYLDAAFTKRKLDGDVDLNVMEIDAGYRYRFDEKLYSFGSLGYRSLDEDDLPSDVAVEASGLVAKAGAGFNINHSTKVEVGAEYSDETLDIGGTEAGSESEVNGFISGSYFPGDSFSFTAGYRALYKETFFEVSYNF